MKLKTKQLIEQEQVYQEDKWVDHKHTVGEWLLILQNILSKANKQWMENGDIMALYEIIQLASSGITCLDEHSGNTQGRKLNPHLHRIWEDTQEFPKDQPIIKTIDQLSKKIEQLSKDLSTAIKENKAKDRQIKELKQKVADLEQRLREEKHPSNPWKLPRPFPKDPPYMSPYHEPYQPWRHKEQPQWDPNTPGRPLGPTFTCKDGDGFGY